MNIKIFNTFLGLAFIATIYGCGNGESKAEKKKEKPLTIATITLKKEKLSTQLNLPGELIALQQVDLYAKVSSFVKSLKVDIGSEVSKGQLDCITNGKLLPPALACDCHRIKGLQLETIGNHADLASIASCLNIGASAGSGVRDDGMSKRVGGSDK